MTERQIQKVLKRCFVDKSSNKALIPNIYWFTSEFECDAVMISNQNHLTEFEIKCTKADFENDFRHKEEKHGRLDSMKDISIIPNHFYFVCPEHLIPPNQVPNYAGLIYIIKLKGRIGYYAKIILNAPILHKETIPAEQWEKLAMKLLNRL